MTPENRQYLLYLINRDIDCDDYTETLCDSKISINNTTTKDTANDDLKALANYIEHKYE